MGGEDSRVYRTLIESELYSNQLRALEGKIERLDEILAGVLWGIALAPEVFPVISGYRRLRLAKSREFEVPFASPLPVLQIWFAVDDVGQVELMAIEREPEDPFAAYLKPQ
jgi:hypothetical protein